MSKPTNQSTSVRGGDANHGNDGNFSTEHDGKHCTETQSKPSPWWKVDLLKPYAIKVIRITTRGCCGELFNLLFYSTGQPDFVLQGRTGYSVRVLHRRKNDSLLIIFLFGMAMSVFPGAQQHPNANNKRFRGLSWVFGIIQILAHVEKRIFQEFRSSEYPSLQVNSNWKCLFFEMSERVLQH